MNDVLFTPLRLNELEALIQNSVEKAFKNHSPSSKDQYETDQLLTIQQAAELLNLSVPTLYGYVQRAEIPVYKRSKRLYFLKQVLIDWVKDGRKKTTAEIKQAADDYINKKGLKYGK
ncbi:MAG: helix-turn-helix domain-containing protein [Bacteroidales bacterium]|nr:helix-turn-helix domain-containing protein [Bacteroidales bacterium]